MIKWRKYYLEKREILMKTDNSKKIYEKAKKSIPGGVNSPVRAFQSVDKEYPIFIKRGNVCRRRLDRWHQTRRTEHPLHRGEPSA